MMPRRLLMLACAFLFHCLNTAQAQTCANVLRALDGYEVERSDCECGRALKNIVVRPPRGLRLVGACALRVNGIDKVDLDTTRLVVDDHFSNLEGILYFAGPVELRGTAWRNMTEASEMGFAPDFGFDVAWPTADKKAGFRDALTRLQFEDGTSVSALQQDLALSGKLKGKTCALAEASIRVLGIKVASTDSDYQGAFALGAQVLHVSPYHACPAHWSESQGD
jgi:hypothetical protein